MTTAPDARITLDDIVERVSRHEPSIIAEAHRQGRAAATALVLREDPQAGPSILFIERTERDNDRWSGQMALPGGRPEAGDADLAETARRETFEEVGLDLPEPIGRLDDLGTRISGMVVSTYIFVIDHDPQLTLEPQEVQSAVWIPLSHLASPDSVTTTWYHDYGPFPAICWDRYTVWGLTYRTLTRFLGLIGCPVLPDP